MFVQPQFRTSKFFLCVPSDLSPQLHLPPSPGPVNLPSCLKICSPRGLSLVLGPACFAHGEQAMSRWVPPSSLELLWITSSISLDQNHMARELWNLGHFGSTKVHCAKS